MINILVSFDNSDFTQTRINATLEEAKQYYIGNYFTFGTCEENEHKVKAVNVVLFDEWKLKVLKFCMENNNTVLKFDDEKQEFTFITNRNEITVVLYDQLNLSMFQFEKATHSHYIDILSKVGSEQNFEFENEMYLYDAYQTSILEYSKSYREEETDLSYHEWLENHVSYAILEGV